jgi:hypothetical protein
MIKIQGIPFDLKIGPGRSSDCVLAPQFNPGEIVAAVFGEKES